MQTSILSELHLSDYFDFVLSSSDCGFEKPNRQIFTQALDMASITLPSLALHIGDHYEKDFVGAKVALFRS